MKNVNLTNLFLLLSASFGVSGFELSCITPIGGEPIDTLIYFKNGNVTIENIPVILQMVKDNVSNDAGKEIGVSLKGDVIQVYVEFAHEPILEA